MVPGRRISPLKILVIVLVFTMSFFTGKFVADWSTAEEPQKIGGSSDIANKEGYELPVNRLNVLLLGTDARKGEKDARTDSMLLVSIDRDTKKIAMVSIPRDTMVEIDGHGTNKINSANIYGGPDLARETVEQLLGAEIPYYVKTNFSGFKEIIDILGGVEIDVDKRMYYPAEDINLKPGLQKLNGYDALGYVRYRHDALGDINRTERQQKFLKSLAKEMLRPGTIIKAPFLVPKLMDAVETNLGVGDAILVAKAASSLDSANIVTATLPGVFYNYKGASYWKVDQEKAHLVLKDLFAGVRVATITGPDENVPSDKPAKKDRNTGSDSDKESSTDNAGSNGQTTEGQNSEGQTGEGAGTDNSGGGQQGSTPSGTGQNPAQPSGQYPGQDQGGQYPGQDQGGQYPGQGQSGQYPGQDQGIQNPSQPPAQTPNEQVIINGQNPGDTNTTVTPGTPPTGLVQTPGDSTNAGQSAADSGGVTSSSVVYKG